MAALEQMFSVSQDDQHGYMEATADAFKQLSEANAQLEKYKRTYGDLSTLSPDVSRLAEQLRTKEVELERLRISLMQQTEVFQNSSVRNTHKLTPCSLKSLYMLN